MLYENGSSSKGCNKIDLGLVEKVVILALESGMGLLLDLENDISGLNTWSLVTLATEVDLVSSLDTSIHMDVEDLSLDNCLLSVAALALVLLADDLSLSITVWADSLEALDHGSHLAHHGLHTVTIATSTLLDSALLSTTAIALRADNRLLERKLRNLATVDILQRDLVYMVDCPGLWRATLLHTSSTKHSTKSAAAAESSSTTKELGEEILSVHATGSSATFQSFLTILVVDGAFLGIGKNFVCVGEILEFIFRIRIVCVLICWFC